MTLRGPLKAELFKYRKRKQISLDGIAGVPQLPSGSDKPVMGYIPPGSASESFLPYDPASARYEDVHPSYDPPPSWFDDLHIAPPPDIRMDAFPEPMPTEKPLTYERSLAAQNILQEFLRERDIDLYDTDAANASADETSVEPDAAETIDDPASPEPMYDESVAPEEMDGFSPLEQMVENEFEGNVPDPAPQGFLPEADLAPDLGQLTQQAFDQAMQPQQPAGEFEDPFLRMQMTYDQQMQMLLAPFALPGPFGPMPGPFGPMPGP